MITKDKELELSNILKIITKKFNINDIVSLDETNISYIIFLYSQNNEKACYVYNKLTNRIELDSIDNAYPSLNKNIEYVHHYNQNSLIDICLKYEIIDKKDLIKDYN